MTVPYYLVEPCATSNAFEVKLEGLRIDLAKAEAVLEKEGSVFGRSDVLLQGSFRKHPLSVYSKGMLLIRAEPGKRLDRHGADDVAAELLALLDSVMALIPAR